MPIYRSTEILRFLAIAAMRKPKWALAVALLALVALASTMTYTVFLVVGVIADYLGTGRILAGLLIGLVFARFPWFSRGKLRTVGLLPKVVRRPVMVSLLALCLSHFLWRGDYVPAGVMGLTMTFLLAFPWIRRAVVGRVMSSIFSSTTKQSRQENIDSTVIDVEFREKKD